MGTKAYADTQLNFRAPPWTIDTWWRW